MGSQGVSIPSINESVAYGSPNRTMAVYKGLMVAVYNVNKNEISLTRQDLVELINVCSIALIYYLSRVSLYRLPQMVISHHVVWPDLQYFTQHFSHCMIYRLMSVLCIMHFHGHVAVFTVEGVDPWQYKVIRWSMRWAGTHLLSDALL